MTKRSLRIRLTYTPASPTPWTAWGEGEVRQVLAAILRLDAGPGWVYTVDMVTHAERPEPEPDRSELTQAVTVGICMTLAAVLIVLVLV